ncbi:hypothetical protein [Roseofilum casamattae]|uniref:Uncharacterized protein n=1 Tax=Roseofilum casamattae BLCC-M143 TaxID=3022442 RepID=A0ABT7BR08_9CYAN|nr:hypothetical protein [Roseofilum casamattae]MDJ1181629.1 hypothetical protein [Roseofilum casamattae BLCC-M143]
MNLAQALHTAARRYCMEKHRYWSEEYSKLAKVRYHRSFGNYYTTKELKVFPRYNVLNAILIELERKNPNELVDLNNTRHWIIFAGMNANTVFTSEPSCEITAETIEDERDTFCHFISNLSDDFLQYIEPLPYRRTLAESESEAVRSRLFQKWQITGYEWYPLVESSMPNIKAFDSDSFQTFCSSFDLTRLLSSRGVSRIWEFCPSEWCDRELDVSLIKFQDYGYWSSGDLDWIVYQSYEHSITIGGWLLDEVREGWPEWREYLWDWR